MLNKQQLKGKSENDIISLIYNDIDYCGYTKYYWICVSNNFDNVSHYVRFPSGSELTIVFDDNRNAIQVY